MQDRFASGAPTMGSLASWIPIVRAVGVLWQTIPPSAAVEVTRPPRRTPPSAAGEATAREVRRIRLRTQVCTPPLAGATPTLPEASFPPSAAAPPTLPAVIGPPSAAGITTMQGRFASGGPS